MANFGLLQQIAPPQVVGQLPVQPNPVDQGAQGIMQGLLQGQQMKANNQDIQMNDLKLQQAQQAVQDSNTLRAAAKQGEQQYINAQMQMNPEAAQDYLFKKAQVKNALATAYKTNQEGTAVGLSNYSTALQIQAQLANAALSGKTPQQQQQIWSHGYQLLPSQTQKVVPKQFDQQTAVATIVLAKENMADFMAKQEAKRGPSKDVQTLDELQNQRDTLESNIKQLKAQGKDTSNLQRRLDETQNLLNTKVQNKQTIDNTQGQYGAEFAKQDAQIAGSLATNRPKFTNLATKMDNIKQLVQEISPDKLGPVVDFTKLNQLDPKVQELRADLNDLALQVKDPVYNLGGGQGFTDSDRQFLTQIVGSTAIKKDALLNILNKNSEQYKKQAVQQWEQESSIRKRGPNYDEWLKDNPKPTFDSKSQSNQQYSQEDLEYTAKKYNMTVDQVKAKLGAK